MPQAISVAHHFRESRGYEVDDVDITLNFLRMLHMHFSTPRIRRILKALNGNQFVTPALERLTTGDVFARRAELEASRAFDDD